MKFLFIKDIHLSHRGPVSRIDDWQEAIFAKLEQVAKVAVKIEAKAILIGGDIFHHKTRIAYHVIFRLMDWCWNLRQAGVAVLAIPGNHDEVHDRLESIPSQPLGLLFKSGLMVDVSHTVVPFAAATAGCTVLVGGVPYPDAMDLANYVRVTEARAGANTPGSTAILLAHCFALPTGGQCFGEVAQSYQQLAHLPFDVFCFGHDHSDHGVQIVDGKYFINIGALSRGSIAKEEITRDVKIAVIDLGEGETKVQQVKLKVAPANEVFDLALKEQRDREHDQIEAFVGELSTDLAVTGEQSFRDRVAGMGLTEEVRTRVLQYIAAAEEAQV